MSPDYYKLLQIQQSRAIMLGFVAFIFAIGISNQYHVDMEKTLILLPGLGADERMFEDQLSLPYQLVTPRLLTAQPAEGMSHYAERFAKTLSVESPYVLVGASFGGVLAQALCQFMQATAVILLGSCRSNVELPGYYQTLAKVFGLIPESISEKLPKQLPLMLGKFGQLSKDQKTLFMEMLNEHSMQDLRYKINMLLSVEATMPVSCPVFHIHGDMDKIIPLAKVSPDRTVAGGGHLVNMTHPTAVNAYIEQTLNDLAN